MIHFSIITASFNSEETIKLTFDSILNQTYKEPFEYIVMDGGSTDQTPNIIKEYQIKFKKAGHINFIWVSEPDNGIYHAWNKALKLSKGNWISFLGSDDIYTPKALEVYQRAIAQNPDYEYFHSKIDVYNKGRYMRTLNSQFNEKGLPITVAHVGTFHSKELYTKEGNYSLDYKIASDYEFLLRFGEVEHYYVNQTLVEMDEEGVSSSFKTQIECYKIMLRSPFFPNILATYYFVFWGLRFYVYQIITKILGKKFIPKLKRLIRFN